MKKFDQKKIIKILLITFGISFALLALMTWAFNLPGYFTGEKELNRTDLKNSISVKENMSYDISELNEIDVLLFSSDIDVSVGEGDQVSFLFIGNISSKRNLKGPYLTFEKIGGVLKIKSTLSNIGLELNSNLVLKISLPENSLNRLKLTTNSGDIIHFGNSFENLTMISSSGKISVSGFKGKSLNIASSSGDKNLIDIDVETLILSSSSGDIHINDSSSLETTIKTSSGGIESEEFKSEETRIKVSSGDVEFYSYSGSLNFSSSSGSLKVLFHEEGDEIIGQTSSGNISLSLYENANFKIVCSTSSGDFTSDFPISFLGRIDERDFEGIVGDGASSFHLDTSSGDIHINKR